MPTSKSTSQDTRTWIQRNELSQLRCFSMSFFFSLGQRPFIQEVKVEPILINATDLRIKTREIMERVKYRGEIFLIQTFGQPTAIIISLDEYAKLTGQLKMPDKTLVHETGQS